MQEVREIRTSPKGVRHKGRLQVREIIKNDMFHIDITKGQPIY